MPQCIHCSYKYNNVMMNISKKWKNRHYICICYKAIDIVRETARKINICNVLYCKCFSIVSIIWYSVREREMSPGCLHLVGSHANETNETSSSRSSWKPGRGIVAVAQGETFDSELERRRERERERGGQMEKDKKRSVHEGEKDGT